MADETIDFNAIISDESKRSQLLQTLGGAGYIVRSTDEENTFKSNLLEQGVSDKIGDRVREIHTQYEQDIASTTGYKKEGTEKAYDFNKRVLADLKKKNDEYAQQLNELQEKLKTADTSGQLKTLEETYRASLSEKEQEIQRLQADSQNFQKNLLLEAEYGNIKKNFEENLPSYFQTVEQVKKEHFMKNSTIVEVDGNRQLVLTKEDGTPALDKNLSYVTASAYFSEEFKDVMKKSTKINGAGTKGGKPLNVAGTLVDLPTAPKSKADLNGMLMKAGLRFGSKEYDEAYNEKIAEYKL